MSVSRPNGPLVEFTMFELDQTVVLANTPVTVRWRTLNADVIRIVRPDGYTLEFDARTGGGSHTMIVERTGAIHGIACAWSGGVSYAHCVVATFEMPQTVEIPVPDLGDVPMPVFGRTLVPGLDRSALVAGLLVGSPIGTPMSVIANETTARLLAARTAWMSSPPGLLPSGPPRADLADPLTDGRLRRRLRVWFRMPVSLLPIFTGRPPSRMLVRSTDRPRRGVAR